MVTPRFLSLIFILSLATSGCRESFSSNAVSETKSQVAEGSIAPKEEPELPLEKDQREFLFEVEHHGLVLSRVGFPLLANALSQADSKTLRELLAADFTGHVLARPREVRVANDFAEVVRQQDAGNPPEALSRDQFVAHVLAYRRNFYQPPKVQVALMALAPTDRDKMNLPWEGTCQLRMWGESEGGQPEEVVLQLKYRVSKPTGDTLAGPGWLHSCSILQTQVARSPHFLMREVAAERGIDTRPFQDNWSGRGKFGITGGVYLCDFDRDGILDLLITDVRRYALYKGLPNGKFVEVTAQVGLPRRPEQFSPLATLAAFVDLDGDGWEDLILGNRIYRNDHGQRFLDYTDLSNLRLPKDASGVAVADYDRDGRMDLYVTRLGKAKIDSWLVGKSGDPRGNQLWHNQGSWQFEEVAGPSGATGSSRSTFTAAWLDANNDGWPDLYVLNEFGNGVLLVNNGDGTFREQQLVFGPGDFGSMGIACGDIDNDGNIDVYVANMYSKAGNRVIGNLRPGTYPSDVMAKMRQFVAGSQLYRNRGRLQFEAIGQQCQVAAVGWSHGALLADLDNDGWLDLFVTAGYMSQSRDEPDG